MMHDARSAGIYSHQQPSQNIKTFSILFQRVSLVVRFSLQKSTRMSRSVDQTVRFPVTAPSPNDEIKVFIFSLTAHY